MTGQRLLHLFNGVAAILAIAAARAGWGPGTAKHVALGALTAAASVGLIGWLVRLVTRPGPGTAGKGAAGAALAGQLLAVGALIWFLAPEGLPFGSGFLAVLAATVVAALIDGLMRWKEHDAGTHE